MKRFFIKDEQGQAMVEYVSIICLVALVAMIAFQGLGVIVISQVEKITWP